MRNRILSGHVPCKKTVQKIEKDSQLNIRSKSSDSESSESDSDSETENPQDDLSYNIVYSVSCCYCFNFDNFIVSNILILVNKYETCSL